MRPVSPRTRSLRRLPVIGSLVAIALAVTAFPAAAADPYHRVLVGRPCVEGHRYASGGDIKVVQKRGGSTLATGTVPSAPPDWSVCLKTIRAGDKLRIIQRVSGSVVSDRTLTVPTLTVTLAPATDVQSGHVPTPGTEVNYGVIPTVAGYDTYEIVRGAVSDLNGNVTDSWTGVIDIRKGDVATFSWYTARDDGFLITAAAPSVGVEVGNAIITGTGPSGPVTTTIRTATGTLRGTATSRIGGYGSTFEGRFRSAGRSVKVKVGDRVRSTGIRGSYKVRASDLKVTNTGNGSLTATCAEGSDYAIFINGVWAVSGMSGAGGTIGNANLTNGGGPLFVGSEVTLACRLPSGFGQVFAVIVK